MSEKFVQQMKKGVLDMTVLKLIVEKDTYGTRYFRSWSTEEVNSSV